MIEISDFVSRYITENGDFNKYRFELELIEGLSRNEDYSLINDGKKPYRLSMAEIHAVKSELRKLGYKIDGWR